jgi:hypothetical protein
VFDPLWLGQVCVKRFTLQISVTLSCRCIANTPCLWQNDKRRRHRDCADKGLSAFLFCTSFCGRISICVSVSLLDNFTSKFMKLQVCQENDDKFTANTQKRNKYNFAWLNKYTHTHTYIHKCAHTQNSCPIFREKPNTRQVIYCHFKEMCWCMSLKRQKDVLELVVCSQNR